MKLGFMPSAHSVCQPLSLRTCPWHCPQALRTGTLAASIQEGSWWLGPWRGGQWQEMASVGSGRWAQRLSQEIGTGRAGRAPGAAWLPCALRPLRTPRLLPSELPVLSCSCVSHAPLGLSVSQESLLPPLNLFPLPLLSPPLPSVSPQPETRGVTLSYTPNERSHLSCLNHPQPLPFSLPPETTPPSPVTSPPPYTSLLPRGCWEVPWGGGSGGRLCLPR